MKIIKALLLLSTLLFAMQNDAEFVKVQNYYSNITKAANSQKWWDVIYFCKLLSRSNYKQNFSDTTFYLAEAFFHVNEYEDANKLLSKYLSQEISPKFFEKSLNYKYQIAKKYYEGTKKHIFGAKKMPKILPAKEDALVLFEEVINTLPNDPISIESLFYKAKIHVYFAEYKEAIDSFQSLIKKFPKSDLAIDSFLEIGKAYLYQADPKMQDPSLLNLAEINLKKFKETFPKEERITDAEKDYKKLQEIYAQGLFEIGKFYEKTKKKEASVIYYNRILSLFPNTEVANLSKKRLQMLND